MKKIILLVAICLFTGAAAFSQSFSVGLKGGANLGKIQGHAFKDEFSLGYHAGAFATIGFSKKFAIQPEVLFSQINNDTTTEFSDVFRVKNISSVKLKYLSIPLLINYNLDKFIAIQAGPQFSILMNENDNLLKNGQNAFQSGEFSVVGGIQLKILKFRAYGRYVGGLTNINHIPSSGAWKASSFQLGVGFAL